MYITPSTTTTIKLYNGDIITPVFEYKKGFDVYLPRCISKDYIVMKKGKYAYKYIALYGGFDIETTNIIKDDKKHAYMYIWQLSLCNEREGALYIGRTWADFISLLEYIKDFYKISPAQRIILWDANFSFEYQFLRHQIQWDIGEYTFFAKEERKPLLATCYGGIEFRECQSISGSSLAQLAKDYTKTQKLVGDLDYKKLRHSGTILAADELQYCYNDVIILAEFSQFIFKNYIIPDKKVPLTKTGLLRSEVKTELKRTCKDLASYKGLIKTAFPSQNTYQMWFKYLFRGGFVHSNFTLTNQVLSGVKCYDITSSYPARMNLSYYPVTPFKNAKFSPDLLKTHCCIMVVTFYNIRTTTMHSIESLHKAINYEDAKVDNGRIYRASMLQVMLTELDLFNYKMFYQWDKLIINSFQVAERGNLPLFIRRVLNKHYLYKASLKAQGLSDTPEYAIAKSGVNAGFGLMVTRISLDKVTIDEHGNWITDKVAVNFKEEIEKQFLLPQWGIYVSAHARHQLLTMVKKITSKCGNIVIYCDTDSIKALYHPDISGIIENYNNYIANELKMHKLTHEAFHDLGMFDDEYKNSTVTRFKTLGAKRYLTEFDNAKIKATIAGLPKNTIHNIKGDVFEEFDIDGMRIEAEYSDKLTTYYNDEYTEDLINDGSSVMLMSELSSVALYEIPFTLVTDKEYYNMVINSAMLRQKL